jgi:hypothetical protein
MTEKHIEDIKLFTSKVIYLEEGKSKLSADAKAEFDKANTDKQDLLIQKAILEERLESEKAKTRTSYFVAALLFAFLIVLFFLISLQVF